MESALEVLSRAATMVNTSSDNRLTITKELPTTKWRRDRRIRLSSEYHHSNHESAATAAAATAGAVSGTALIKPLGESNQSNSISDNNSMEIPLDMSVGAASKPPPPPYRDPLPGSTFCMSRPSVITQAPKREVISNQENKERSSPAPTLLPPKKQPIANSMCDDINPPATESISMIDAVIDEHFRRSLGSLGSDYKNLFGKRLNQLKSPSSIPAPATPITPPPPARKSAQVSPIRVNSPEPLAQKSTLPPYESKRSNENDSKSNDEKISSCVSATEKESKVDEDVEMSVDDHFAKALGDTWKQLQQHTKLQTSPVETDHEKDMTTDSVNNSKSEKNETDDDDDDDDARSALEIDTSNDNES